MLKHVRRASIALATTGLLVTGLVSTPTATAVGGDGTPTPESQAAASWLASQLGDDDLVTSEYQDFGTGEWVAYTDHGLTLDFFFAFDALEVRTKLRGDILRAVEAQAGDYVGTGDTAYAGAHGKLLTAVLARGLDPRTYADQDLLARLEGLVRTEEGDQQGRASDTWAADNPYGGDYSNTIGQAWVVRALTGADSDLAPLTTAFLLKQQCADGSFRLYMESADFSCDGGTAEESKPSVDATAFAIQALLVARAAGTAGLRDDIRDAESWLVEAQRDNGSFVDEGAANANSTGVAAEALAALGRHAAAARSAAWLGRLRVTGRLATRSAFRDGDTGAVAFSRAALMEGKDEGISRDVRYQWRRATAQAAVGLDSLTS